MSYLIYSNAFNSYKAAVGYIKDFLGENYSSHPDYYEVFSDTKTMGVEYSERINSICASAPSLSDKRYIIIRDFQKFTVDAQNMLLKIMEDSEDTEIFGLVTGQGNILDTIKSRCKEIRLANTLKEFEYDGPNKVERYFITSGDNTIDVDEKVLDVFVKVRKEIKVNPNNLYKLLDTLDILLPFTNGFLNYLLYLLNNSYTCKTDIKAINVVSKELQKSGNISYSKDDLFAFFVNLIFALN